MNHIDAFVIEVSSSRPALPQLYMQKKLNGALMNSGSNNDLITLISGSTFNSIDAPDLLEELEQNQMRTTDIMDFCGCGRKAANSALTLFIEAGIVHQQNNEYTLSPCGSILLRRYNRAREFVPQMVIVSLLRSESKPQLLYKLQDTEYRIRELRNHFSSATINRTLREFEEIGWIDNQGYNHTLNHDGKRGLMIFEQLITTFSGIDEKRRRFLNRFESIDENIPVDVLDDASIIEATPDDPHNIMKRIKEESSIIWETDPQPLLGVSPAFSDELVEHFKAFLEAGKEFQQIVDQTLYRTLCHPKHWQHLSLATLTNLEIRVYPDNISIGVLIMGREKVIVSAHSERYPFNTALISDNDKLIEWGYRIYDTYYQESRTITEDFFSWIM